MAKVFVVLANAWDGDNGERVSIKSVWATKEKAEADCPAQSRWSPNATFFEVEEYEIQD